MRFFLILAIISPSQEIIFNCGIYFNESRLDSYIDHSQSDYYLSCYDPDLSNLHERELTDVFGQHYPGQSNLDVQGLVIFGKIGLTYFPQNIHLFFPNLMAISIIECPIVYLKPDELQAFGANLRAFVIIGSDKLEKVPGYLFEWTPNIEVIVFRKNAIKFVGANLLDYPNKARIVDFRENSCANVLASNSSMVPAIREILIDKCGHSDFIRVVEVNTTTTTLNPEESTTTTTPESTTTTIQLSCEEIIRQLEEENKILEDENLELKIQLDNLLAGGASK